MEINALLKTVILGLKAKDHESALDRLFGAATEDLRPPSRTVDKRFKAFCDLRSHESTEGALAGTGAAVFHCLSEYVQETRLAIAVCPHGVPKSGKKGTTRLFFLLISPMRESGSHLQTLSLIEGFLQDRAFIHALLSAKSEGDVKNAVRRKELAGKLRYIPISKDEVLRELDSNLSGLSTDEAKRRLELIGPNTLRSIRARSLFKDLIGNFTNLFAILLWVGGALCFVAGLPQLGWAIFLVIAVNGLFSFWQEYKAEKAVEALTKLLPIKAKVVRDNKETEVDARELVPGDIVELSEGDSIPADGRLIKTDDMRVDNSALTGESKPVYKLSEPVEDKGFIWTELPNMVFAGTSLLSGAGRMVVTATGMDTEIGRVAFLTETIGPDMSPLQKEMASVTKRITLIAVSLGALFFMLGALATELGLVESLVFAIGIIVALVPEGLLPTVTLSLAMGVQRMARKNAIVKKLSSVETLGCATVICTDKTGTLTANNMCVRAIYLNGSRIEATGAGYEASGEFLLNNAKLSKEELDALGVTFMAQAAALCTNAALVERGAGWTVIGDPTEGALLALAKRAGVDLAKLDKSFPRVAHLPFERIRKMMSTIHASPDELHGRIAFVKGAPNEVLRLSTHIRAGNKDEPIDKDRAGRILAEFDIMAGRGERVLGIAFRRVGKEGPYSIETVEKDLVFLGLVSMVDPPRPGVKEAVEECRGAGIKVVMITGDYGLTAKAIAEEVGIEGSVITGDELSAMSKPELKERLKKGTAVFARVTPEDKLRVVEALQENGEVVAATGDGVNDAPALKKADIGIAMGMRGSDVAKEASDMILADDNFATIVDAVREGRAVYANIRKFVTYIFASNIPELVPFIAFVIFKVPLPLTVMQILAVDLGTDVLPALALGVEKPEKAVMKERPRPLDKRLLDLKTMARAYLFLGPVEAALCMSAFFFAFWARGVDGALPSEGPVYMAATTMTFAAIVAAQIGNVFACKSAHGSIFTTGLFSNRFMLISIGAELFIAALLIYTPLRTLFGFYPLGALDLILLACFPFMVLGAEEVRKLIARTIVKRMDKT